MGGDIQELICNASSTYYHVHIDVHCSKNRIHNNIFPLLKVLKPFLQFKMMSFPYIQRQMNDFHHDHARFK